MKVLQPVYCIIDEYLKRTVTKRAYFFFGPEVRKEVPAYGPHVILKFYLRKPSNKGQSADYAFRLSQNYWNKINEDAKEKAVLIGTSRDQASEDEFFFYRYKGRYYMTEIKLSLIDIALIIDQENLTRKEKLMKEVERVRARVEIENGVRQPIPEDVQILVWNRDQGKCVKCGSNQNLEFDHIIPLSQGGSNTARNIQLLCEKCLVHRFQKFLG